jgi:hypothetical protein
MSKPGTKPTPTTRIEAIKRASEAIENLAKKIELQIDPSVDEIESLNEPWPNNLNEFQDDYEEIVEPFDESIIDVDIEHEPYGSAIGRIGEEGIEAIAFYKSFRFKNYQPAKGLWGIFYIKPRFKALQIEMCLDLNIKSSEGYTKLHEFLYGHEIYHYKVDAICLQHESFMNKFLYRPYRNFVGNLPISDWWEEAVANHYALTKNDGKLTQFFSQLILNSPGAYAKGIYKDNAWNSINPRSYLAEQIEQSIRPTSLLVNEILFDELKLSGHKKPRMIFSKPGNDSYLTKLLAIKNCPQYWISWARFGKVVPNLIAPDLREIENEYVGKYLNGQKLKRSDHTFFKIDNGEKVKMPNPHSKTIKPHEFKNIVSKAGMTIIDFWNERQKTKKWKKNSPRVFPLDPIKSKK